MSSSLILPSARMSHSYDIPHNPDAPGLLCALPFLRGKRMIFHRLLMLTHAPRPRTTSLALLSLPPLHMKACPITTPRTPPERPLRLTLPAGRSAAVFMCLFLLSLTLPGCHSRQSMMHNDSMATPWEQGQPWRSPTSSSVLHTPQALTAMARTGHDPDAPAWYDTRNDHQPSVAVPAAARIVYQRSITRSHDHFSTTNGRVRDNAHTHTHNIRIETTTR